MRHLISQLMDEEFLNSLYKAETGSEFIQRIHDQLMDEMKHLQSYAPMAFTSEIKEEIIKEVTDIYRVKTYGFYNLQDYKKSLETKSA